MAELRAIPQSPTLGKIARGLRSLQELAGQYQVLPQVPLLGGTSVDDLLGLPGAAREVENWSYGNYPIQINPNAGRTASYIPEVKPNRKSDLADTLLLGLDVAPLAGMAAKGVARAARTPLAQGIDRAVREGYERGLIPAPGMTIKPKGGNWLANNPETALDQFRTRVIGQDPANRLRDLEASLAQNIEAGVPVDMGIVERERARLAPDIAVNKWIDTKLAKYIRNEMGTPEDPLRKLADQGTLHFNPRGIRDVSPMMNTIRERRTMGGFPVEDTATTPLGQQWERYADIGIETTPSQVRVAELKNRGTPLSKETLAENPWLEKLPTDTPVYSPDSYAFVQSDEQLGFPHLIDELKNAMNPESDLPRNLRIDPKDIDKITVPQAVEKVSQINAWRAKQAAEAEKAGMLGNLQATPRLADENLQLSFVDKPGGAWVDIPETIDEKGMRICNSIGKAGGWCTQDKWAAESYGSGANRLAALVDSEGRPHAQAKITQDVDEMSALDSVIETMTPEQETAYMMWANELDRPPELQDALNWMREEAPDLYRDYQGVLSSQPKSLPDITELKPPGNTFDSARAQEYIKRDPQYKQKVTDSVLNFLNSQQWGRVADLHHYNIIDIQNPRQVMEQMQDLFGNQTQLNADIFNAALDSDPYAPRFMRRSDFIKFVEPPNAAPTEGFAGGGAVKALGKLVQKYLAKEGAETAAEAPVKEQKMLQGFYRGYAGDYDAGKAAAQDSGVFVSPQRAVGEYYANKRAGQTGLDPHLEMILADPFAGRGYGHSTMGTGKNPPMITRARELKPEDVKDRTKLYARGGMVDYDPDEIAQIAERATQGFAAGGLVNYDPNEIDTIVSKLKEEFHG